MSLPHPAADVIVVGGGVIGLSIAWELARNNVRVRVLEQGQFGQEASWAGAGMLPPGNPEAARTAEGRLRGGSHLLWPEWTEQLRSLTGIDNGFRRCGGVEVCLPESNESLDPKIAAWQAEQVAVEPLQSGRLHELVPALHPEIVSGYLLPELGQVRNPRHLKALLQACASSGVDLRPGTPVIDLVHTGERITSVRTPCEDFTASEVVIAGGAWTRTILQRAGLDSNFEPVRGQIVLLETRPSLIRHVIEVGNRYLVPRPDGRVLIGSTEERAGFEKRTTAGGVSGLIEFGRRLIPELANARFERCWAGLRPYAPGGLPVIGRVPGMSNLSLAAGHFRAGLQLSPMTAVLIRQLILGQPGHEWADEFRPNSKGL